MVHRRREADNVCGHVVRLQGSRTKTKTGYVTDTWTLSYSVWYRKEACVPCLATTEHFEMRTETVAWPAASSAIISSPRESRSCPVDTITLRPGIWVDTGHLRST
jgi:hypothetical protein